MLCSKSRVWRQVRGPGFLVWLVKSNGTINDSMGYIVSSRACRVPLATSTGPSPVCEVVNNQYSQAIQTTKSLLETLIRNHSLISLDYTPLETYAKEQSVRLGHDVLKRLNALVLSRDDVKEHIENIVASFKLYQSRYSLEGAVMAMKCLRVFIAAIGDTCNLLEYTAGLPSTNWGECVKLCEAQLRSFRIRSAFSPLEYIPKIQDFRCVRTLGGGGFGVVYEAIHIPTDVRVCVKLIITSRLKRLSYAALDKIVASVSEHPKIVQYHASFLTTAAYVTVMEYVGGIDVLKYVQAMGEIIQYPDQYCIILNQMVKAVSHIHAHGFIHRDIKPQNALLLPGGHIKLIDFDTCKICIAHFVDTYPLTGYFARTAVEFEDRDYAGTLAFMPPEIINHKPYGRAVDWWAIGVTAYRLVTGKMPYREKERSKLRESIRKHPICIPDFVGTFEKDFIARLLIKNPHARLGSENYDELIQHQLFDYYNADKTLDESYFDTARVQELVMQKKVSKKIRIKTKERKYLELKECASIPMEDQKSLLMFASINWRMLLRPDDPVYPFKTDLDAEHDLELLLETPEPLAADTYPSSWGSTDIWLQSDINSSTTNYTHPSNSLVLNSRLKCPLDEYIKSNITNPIVEPTTSAPTFRKREPTKKRRKKRTCVMA